jgi:DNA-binding NarL/FixJ family response regulator
VILAAHRGLDTVPPEDLRAARTHSDQAAELLRRWGGWRVEELAAVQARLATDPSAQDGLLTPRECEVARLIADGLTNAEIARRLFISPRTAAVHVSNILRKLDLASRADVASALEKANLSAPAPAPGRPRPAL